MASAEQTLTPAVSFCSSSSLACISGPEHCGPCLGLGEPRGWSGGADEEARAGSQPFSGQSWCWSWALVLKLPTLSGPWGWDGAEPRWGSWDTLLPLCLVQVSLPRPECEKEEKEEGIKGFHRWRQPWGTEPERSQAKQARLC